MELKFARDKIEFEKEINSLDRFVIDFSLKAISNGCKRDF